jgi:hypothetical protein
MAVKALSARLLEELKHGAKSSRLASKSLVNAFLSSSAAAAARASKP